MTPFVAVIAASRHAGAKHCCAFELGPSRFRIYDQARVQSHIHSRNSHLTLIIDLDLNHRGYIRQEAPVRRNSDAGSFPCLRFPTRIFATTSVTLRKRPVSQG